MRSGKIEYGCQFCAGVEWMADIDLPRVSDGNHRCRNTAPGRVPNLRRSGLSSCGQAGTAYRRQRWQGSIHIYVPKMSDRCEYVPGYAEPHGRLPAMAGTEKHRLIWWSAG